MEVDSSALCMDKSSTDSGGSPSWKRRCREIEEGSKEHMKLRKEVEKMDCS